MESPLKKKRKTSSEDAIEIEQQDYEVEDIVGKTRFKGKIFYLGTKLY
jgi:hypothetical protein